jgi:hypothetical protein
MQLPDFDLVIVRLLETRDADVLYEACICDCKKMANSCVVRKIELAGLCDQDLGHVVFAMTNKETWPLED